jgi:hypothetical protein
MAFSAVGYSAFFTGSEPVSDCGKNFLTFFGKSYQLFLEKADILDKPVWRIANGFANLFQYKEGYQ